MIPRPCQRCGDAQLEVFLKFGELVGDSEANCPTHACQLASQRQTENTEHNYKGTHSFPADQVVIQRQHCCRSTAVAIMKPKKTENHDGKRAQPLGLHTTMCANPGKMNAFKV